MTNNPKISIVMPVFNRMELVKEMIDSIKANSFPDWELIAVDDGSDRETLDFLHENEAGDSRIRVFIRTELPKGPLTCRNIGFAQAKGEYIVFFDSDDYITSDCLGNRVRCMDQNPDADFMVFPAGEYIDGKIDCKSLIYSYGYQINKDDITAFCSRFSCARCRTASMSWSRARGAFGRRRWRGSIPCRCWCASTRWSR